MMLILPTSFHRAWTLIKIHPLAYSLSRQVDEPHNLGGYSHYYSTMVSLLIPGQMGTRSKVVATSLGLAYHHLAEIVFLE